MIRGFILSAAVALCLATPALAFAPHRVGAGIPQNCQFGTGLGDGCAGANQNGSFEVASTFGVSFYQHAATSGQTWSSVHPWTWNAAGIDYPVGYDKTLTLKDPATASLPTGCTWFASGTNLSYTGPQVYCSGSTSTTLDGYDLSLYGGVHVRSCLTGGAAFILSDSRIKIGAASDQATGVVVVCTSQAGSATVRYNEFDGNFRDGHVNATDIVTCNTSCDIEYNYVHDWPAQVFNDSGNASTVTVRYNYVEGFSLYTGCGGSCRHGAVLQNVNTANNSDEGTQVEQYNTVVYPSGYMSLQNTTAFSFLGSATQYNQKLSTGVLDHNVVVANCAASFTNAQGCPFSGGYSVVNTVLTEPFRLSEIGSWTVQDNFVDPHGAVACIQTLGDAGIVATISNGAGGAGYLLNVTDYTSSGTLLTFIYPYQYLTSSADSVLNVSNSTGLSYYILPYGDSSCNGGTPTSGTGGTGTYCLASPSGGPLNLASAGTSGSSVWQTSSTPINPSPGNPTNPVMSGNTNLLDGSAITIAGVQMNTGQCHGRAGTTL